MRVIFIIGKGRSGSTLLDSMLNEVPGLFSTGELWRRWGRWPMDAYRCGCGHRVGQCPLWTPILERVYERTSRELGCEVTARRVLEWEEILWSIPENVRLAGHAILDRPLPDRYASLVTVMKHTYAAIAEIANVEVLVDSSKWPLLPGPLGLVDGIEPRLLHLVRDSRAVAHSWTREKEWYSDGPDMPVFHPVYSALGWWRRNGLAEFTMQTASKEDTRRITYEELIERPENTLRKILALVDMEEAPLPLQNDGKTLTLRSNHTMWGNKSRFRTGRVVLKRDDHWQTEQRKLDWLLTTIITAPLLARYSYPLRK